MSNDRETAFTPRDEQIPFTRRHERMLEDIAFVSLGGVNRNGEAVAGLGTVLKDIYKELYGDGKGEKGIKAEVRELRDARVKLYALMAASGGGGAGIMHILSKLFGGH